jgi:hypothetical protein
LSALIKDFAAALQPCWVKQLKLHVPGRMTLPAADIDPGALVRSILLGMCGTGPAIVDHWPELPKSLVAGEPIALPTAMKLYLALAKGVSARVAGPIFGFHLMGWLKRQAADGRNIGINAIASVYFPPLAWELVHAGETILDDHGWVDVSSWTQLRPGETHTLTDLVPSLPVTHHPYHHPDLSDHWTEVLNSTRAPITECFNIEGGEPDPDSPLTLTARAHATVDEIHEIGRRLGVNPEAF